MIHFDSKQVFEKHIFPGCEVIELGDQLMDAGESFRYQRSDQFYKEKVKITSIDWHGKNRALKLDLSQPVSDKFQADVLTDFGTVEHVKDLYNALLNCHNFTKEGGVMIHVNPKTGTYPGHGNHWFTQDFWKEFAAACKYELIDLYEKPPYSKDNPDIEVYAVLRKVKKSKFISREEFEELTVFIASV